LGGRTGGQVGWQADGRQAGEQAAGRRTGEQAGSLGSITIKASLLIHQS
jgi:hypothetical protein